ncbi:MAG: NYN domain-containing protein [Firmicutes bacterium]|nr:NYN domain-containing protein [Bacillota bacterium]
MKPFCFRAFVLSHLYTNPMLLVDAYNVLHAEKPGSLAGLDLAGLCRALDRTRWVKRGVVVVADGDPGPLGMLASPAPNVALVYSGHGRTADAEIIHRIDVDSSPRRLVVASSDREIRKAARRRRARDWTSEHFLSRLVEQLRIAGPRGCANAGDVDITKPQVAGREVDAWLEAFGIDANDEEELKMKPHPKPPEEAAPPKNKSDNNRTGADDVELDDEDSKYWPPW